MNTANKAIVETALTTAARQYLRLDEVLAGFCNGKGQCREKNKITH